jgi:DNA-binding LacI/PurR family transcriptional regulator
MKKLLSFLLKKPIDKVFYSSIMKMLTLSHLLFCRIIIVSALKRPVNIKQVAKEAKVSVMTVSRVLNQPAKVALETRERVQSAIQELGYQPSAVARSLKTRRTFTIGVITVDLVDNFFNQVTAGAEAEARRKGYRIMISSTERDPHYEGEILKLLAERHGEGILIVRDSIELDNDFHELFPDNSIPMVTTGYKLSNIPMSSIDIDNIDGGEKATSHLIKLGHRRIAMITGPVKHKSSRDRTEGYRQALLEANIPCDERLIVYSDYWLAQCGNQGALELFNRNVDFSAIFVQSDELAMGVYLALRQKNLRIPEDISIVSYDDIPVAEYLDPPLTTIRQPTKSIGIEAVRLLIRQIEGEEGIAEDIHLQTELIERASTILVHPPG